VASLVQCFSDCGIYPVLTGLSIIEQIPWSMRRLP
jgi:hypothetical protein